MAKRKKMKKSKKKMKKNARPKKKAKKGGKARGQKGKKARKQKVKKAKKKMKKARAAKKVSTPKMKPAKKAAKPMTAERNTAVMKAAEAVKERMIGKVVHYYDQIGVAIVELQEPMRLGEMVKLKHGEQEALQRVGSLQIEHQPVMEAKRGDVVGLKVDVPAGEGTIVTWA